MSNPGKFEACENQELGEYLQKLSMDGCDSELGNVESFGWYGLLLNVDGKGFLHLGENKSYIINEDNDGFFTYTTYDNAELANRDWTRLESAYADFENENED